MPATDPHHDTAQRNAMLCYRNMQWAHANAGLGKTAGKVAIEAAIEDDPNHADELKALLAKPPAECPMK